MHFICLRRKFRELSRLIVFSSREILQLICFDEPGIIVSQNAHRSCDAIKLRISRWSLLRDRFASFISLSPTLHLFTIRAHLGRRKRVVCYNVFSLFGHPGRSRLLDGNISRNRNMHGTCYAYTQTGREKIAALRSIASEASTLARFIVFLLMPRLTPRE